MRPADYEQPKDSSAVGRQLLMWNSGHKKAANVQLLSCQHEQEDLPPTAVPRPAITLSHYVIDANYVLQVVGSDVK